MTRSPAPVTQPTAQSRFLIIGYGNELHGDDAVGPKVAEIVESWQLKPVKTIITHQLTPELVNDIVATDYVIFVDACSDPSCARTVQLDPMVVGSKLPRTLPKNTHNCHPLALLNLAKQLYGQAPQAWLLQVPSESFGLGKGLSSTTQRGCDQAVRIIEQFWKTYQQPAWMSMPALA
jgi:hydrogenase maturation protease